MLGRHYQCYVVKLYSGKYYLQICNSSVCMGFVLGHLKVTKVLPLLDVSTFVPPFALIESSIVPVYKIYKFMAEFFMGP